MLSFSSIMSITLSSGTCWGGGGGTELRTPETHSTVNCMNANQSITEPLKATALFTCSPYRNDHGWVVRRSDRHGVWIHAGHSHSASSSEANKYVSALDTSVDFRWSRWFLLFPIKWKISIKNCVFSLLGAQYSSLPVVLSNNMHTKLARFLVQ